MDIINLNEICEEEHYDQPCQFGNRTSGSVYCHSKHPNSPRKCRRSWYTGNEVKDEDCQYYKPNNKKENSKTEE
jgi:hypothetical protein